MRETVSEPSQTERRVLTRSRSDPFLPSEVVGADGHRMRRGGFEQALVRLALFLHAGRRGSRLQIEELRPEEPDPFRMTPFQGADLLRQLQIRSHHDASPVLRGSSPRRPRPQPAVSLPRLADAKESL